MSNSSVPVSYRCDNGWELLLIFLKKTSSAWQDETVQETNSRKHLFHATFHHKNLEHFEHCFQVARSLTNTVCQSLLPSHSCDPETRDLWRPAHSVQTFQLHCTVGKCKLCSSNFPQHLSQVTASHVTFRTCFCFLAGDMCSGRGATK